MVLEHIRKLLFEHDCVIMPDFGGLITHYEPAKIHPVRHTFSPPAKRVAFNEKLKINDGLLISTLAYDQKLSPDEAQQQVSQFVQELQRELNYNKRFDLKGIGIFRLNEESKVVFEYIENENFLQDSFGLPELLSKPVIASEPVILRTLLKDQKEPAQKGFRNTIRRYYRAATALVIGGVVVTGLYLLSVQTDYNVSAINPITLFQSDSAEGFATVNPERADNPIAKNQVTVEVQPLDELEAEEIGDLAADSSILITSADLDKNLKNESAADEVTSESSFSGKEAEAGKKSFNVANPKKLTIAPGEAVLISAKANPVKTNPAKPATPKPVAGSPAVVRTKPTPSTEKKEIKRNFSAEEINAALSAGKTRINPESTNTKTAAGALHVTHDKEVTATNKAATGENASSGKSTTIKPSAERFYVIVNGYSTYEGAERNRQILAKKGRPGQVLAPAGDGKLYRIAIAEYKTREQALQNLPELKNKYGNTIWILKR
ncbi:SPOR domain-containing protein [Adhaeribacter swui]|uniref:SPOR domain-containing protein n=1 Tax=Adhaeribacter swui TaxID=2086471 RepID=A0A7G7GD26_9BACT|nr:SPOR domain-containing protein [Adhaeribacter swui]QNF35060.1 SPOR domain-containing protein [Adhaeribacter swui]